MNAKDKQQQQIEAWLKGYVQTLPVLENGCPYTIRRAYSLAQSRFYENDFNVTRLKKKCRINRNNFSSRFKYFTGHTPKQYMLHLRIEAAKQMLADEAFSKVTAGRLSFALGFSGISAFSRCFKKRTGFSP